MGDGETAVAAAQLAFAGEEGRVGVVGAVDDDGALAGQVVGVLQPVEQDIGALFGPVAGPGGDIGADRGHVAVGGVAEAGGEAGVRRVGAAAVAGAHQGDGAAFEVDFVQPFVAREFLEVDQIHAVAAGDAVVVDVERRHGPVHQLPADLTARVERAGGVELGGDDLGRADRKLGSGRDSHERLKARRLRGRGGAARKHGHAAQNEASSRQAHTTPLSRFQNRARFVSVCDR